MTRRRCAALLLAIVALLGGCAAAERRPGPATQPTGRWAQQDHWLPVTGADGSVRLILGRSCHPGGPDPGGQAAKRLVVINHGKSPLAAEVAAYIPPTCESEAVRWFLERGLATFIPVRRGFGATGGTMPERYPVCAPSRDYTIGSLEAARDIRAAITYATARPGIAPDHVVVVGQSAGGLAAIALASQNDPGVTALVNMAGGDGGHLNRVAHAVCEPPALIRAAARFGTTARAPMLWVYTANDSFFSPALAEAMHRAYTGAGGQARLASLPPWGSDGHFLVFARGGSAVWGPLVEPFLGLKPLASAASALRRN